MPPFLFVNNRRICDYNWNDKKEILFALKNVFMSGGIGVTYYKPAKR